MGTKLTHYRYFCILITIIVLFSIAITPKPVHAWSAFTVKAEGSILPLRAWDLFRNSVSRLYDRFNQVCMVPV